MATKWVKRVRYLNQKADEIQVRLNGAGRYLAKELNGHQQSERRTDCMWNKAAQRCVVIQEAEYQAQTNFPTMVPERKKSTASATVEEL
mmetsp:Transcript_28305/g.46535  ORF Transcript_28305/g.46535 Transcript_28305/m.46535 type:complete len:89 (+) Transcript_28305:431-697(+)